MKKLILKRISIIFLCSIIALSTFFNSYKQAEAAAVVVGSTLLEALAYLAMSMGATYVAVDFFEEFYDLTFQETQLTAYSNTTSGSNAIKTIKNSYTVLDGGSPGSGSNLTPDGMLNISIQGLVMTTALQAFMNGYMYYLDNNLNIDYNSQIPLKQYDSLPDNFYFGRNPVVPENIAAQSNYSNTCPQTVQLSSGPEKYVEWQLNIDALNSYYGLGAETYEADGGVNYRCQIVAYNQSTPNQVNLSFGRVMPSLYYHENNYRGFNNIFETSNFTTDPITGLADYFFTNPPSCYMSGKKLIFYSANGVQSYLFYDGFNLFVDGVVQSSTITTAEGFLQSLGTITGNHSLPVSVAQITAPLFDTSPDGEPVEVPASSLPQLYQDVVNNYNTQTDNYLTNNNSVTENTYQESVTNVYNEYNEYSTVNPDPVSPGVPVTDIKELEDMKAIGLENLFPFCIPFDMYHLITLLSADPVAPSYNWHFDFGILGEYDFLIDLSVFNSVALIVRKMELLCFVLGLILLTRNIIRG